jgi:uncharacterized Rmd1/YagE family protein
MLRCRTVSASNLHQLKRALQCRGVGVGDGTLKHFWIEREHKNPNRTSGVLIFKNGCIVAFAFNQGKGKGLIDDLHYACTNAPR